MEKQTEEKFFKLALETAQNFETLCDYAKDSKYLKELTKAALIFTSFVAFVYDENETQ